MYPSPLNRIALCSSVPVVTNDFDIDFLSDDSGNVSDGFLENLPPLNPTGVTELEMPQFNTASFMLPIQQPISNVPQAMLMHNVPMVKNDKPNRRWMLHSVNPKFVADPTKDVATIEMKHRREKRHQHVDACFFSSISYQTFFTVNLELLNVSIKPEEILVKVKLRTATSFQETSGLDTPKQATMKLHPKKRKFRNHAIGELLLHVESSKSYHFTNTDYLFELEFYHRNTMEHMFSYVTPKIRYYARKANKKQYSREKRSSVLSKRKRSQSPSSSSDEGTPSPKRKKDSMSMLSFQGLLADMFLPTEL